MYDTHEKGTGNKRNFRAHPYHYQPKIRIDESNINATLAKQQVVV
jgi:hypothetical protein